jgi:hypothetical protein
VLARCLSDFLVVFSNPVASIEPHSSFSEKLRPSSNISIIFSVSLNFGIIGILISALVIPGILSSLLSYSFFTFVLYKSFIKTLFIGLRVYFKL